MRLEELRRAELARTLQYEVDIQVLPGKLSGTFALQEVQGLLADPESRAVFRIECARRVRKAALNTIELEEKRHGLCAGVRFVDRDEFEVFAIPTCAQAQATHAPEPVDCDSHDSGLYALDQRGKAPFTPASTGSDAPVVGVLCMAKNATASPTWRAVTSVLSSERSR